VKDYAADGDGMEEIMRIMGKGIALLCVMGLLMGALTGCSSSKTETVVPDATEKSNESTTEEPKEEVTEASEEQIVLTMYDWSDSTKTRREEFNAKYMEAHPNVKIEYTVMTVDQFKSSVVSLILSGDAPDLFPIPAGMTLATAVGEEWYTSLDDLLSQEFLDTLEAEVFSEGVSMVNGSMYSLPDQQAVTNALIFYNKDLLSNAGVEVPTTYSEFINSCKKITEVGNGQYYGLIEGGQQANRLDVLLRSWAQVAGGKIAPSTNALTLGGRAPYDSEEMKGVFEVFAQLVKDGSIHPDTINISAPEARELFAQGQAAFLTQGSWCISTWAETNPELNYGVMAIPRPDGQDTGYIGGGEMGPWIGIYSQSEHKEAAAEYLEALYSEEYQGAVVSDGGFISIIKGVNDKYMTNEQMLEYYNIAKETMVIAPIASKIDNKVYDFYTKVVDVTPNLANLLQGVLSGGVSDYAKELTTLSDNTTEEWKKAAEAAGLDFSTFEIPNWDTTKSFTSEDYEALK
jgi:multiple sugar transport system substrate-binding protein